MSNTRKATDESVYRVEKYASSAAATRYIPAHLLAKRIQTITDRKQRRLLIYLQQISLRDGGLEAYAVELLQRFRERFEPFEARVFDAASTTFDEYADLTMAKVSIDEQVDWMETALPNHLRDLCLNPDIDLASESVDRIGRSFDAYKFPGLVDAIEEHRDEQAAKAADQLADTEVTRIVFDTLDYCLEAPLLSEECSNLVLIEGLERIGKSRSARVWAAMHPGEAVFIKLTSSMDERSFYRTIAKELGVTAASSRSVSEIRDRIVDALQALRVMVVFDEAHFLWGIMDRRQKYPRHIEWIRTALVDYQVPIALIATPQFEEGIRFFERNRQWNSRQFRGRISQQVTLPDSLQQDDLIALGRYFLPEIGDLEVKILCHLAISTDDYIACIERLARRATYLARKDGFEAPRRKHIKQAVEEVRAAGARPGRSQPKAKAPRKAKATAAPASTESAAPVQDAEASPKGFSLNAPDADRYRADMERETIINRVLACSAQRGTETRLETLQAMPTERLLAMAEDLEPQAQEAP